MVELIKNDERDNYMFKQRTHAVKVLWLLTLLDLPDAVLAVIDFVLPFIRFLPLSHGSARRHSTCYPAPFLKYGQK